jgi:hypothetical protein
MTYSAPATYTTHMPGTSVEATCPIRLMPPMMTSATRIDTTTADAVVGMRKFLLSTSATFQPWYMLPPPKELSTVAMAKHTANTLKTIQPAFPRDRSGSTRARCMYHMGPPRTSPRAWATAPGAGGGSPGYSRVRDSVSASIRSGALGSGTSRVSRYMTARVHSMNLRAMPKNPTTHIQNTAPGPPTETATATPAILPSPMVADSAAHNAWKWLIWPASSGLS